MSTHDLLKTTLRDIAYAAGGAAMGSVPVVGSRKRTIRLIVASPLEQRRTKFFIEIGERLKELE